MTNTALPNGCELLDDTNTAIKRFCVLPGEHEYTAVTLWCAYTHFAEAFHYAPRLIARSPHKRSGKTRLYEIVAELVRSPLKSTDATTAYIFRSLAENSHHTLMLDEVDAVFGTPARAAQNEDLRALLNAGFQRGGRVGRTSGPNHTPTEFETFAPAFLSGIGRLPDTIEDRSVVIQMRRKAADEHVQPYRPGRDGRALCDLRDRLSSWGETSTPEAYACANGQQVALPVDDRAADVWEPLLIVANIAGGDWPSRTRGACQAMTAQAAEDDTDTSEGQQLLEDIKHTLTVAFMPSADLCDKLKALPESPWADLQLNPRKLGHRLRAYGIKTRHSTDKTARGYHRADFADAFRRYLRGKPSETVQSVRHGVNLRKQRDGSPDDYVSGTTKASDKNGRSDGMADGLDASGRFTRDPTGNMGEASADKCPDCGTTYGTTGRCVPCIVNRHSELATANSAEEN